MKLKQILKEIQIQNSGIFQNYSPENLQMIDKCRKMLSAQMNKYTNDELNSTMIQLGTRTLLPLDKVLVGQKFVESDVLRKKAAEGDENPCLAFELGGRFYLHDGHHRAALNSLNGESNLDCFVVKMDKYF